MTEWNRWPESSRRMGIGVMVPIGERGAFGGPVRFADMVEMAQAAEAAGLDAIWLADHFLFRPPVAPEGEEYGLWEAWTCAAGLAQATSRINIGLLVTCLGWRNPGLLARMTETIDEISGGRFILGAGAGWHEPEYEAYGFPFDHRVSRFEDAITILDGLLRRGEAEHDGQFFSAKNAVSRPRGPMASKGGAPILVGSTGPRMLGLIARYADAWNSVWHSDAKATLDDLKAVDAALAEAGRDPDTLVRTAGGNIALPGYTGSRGNPIEGDNDAIAGTLAGFRDLGYHHFVGGLDPCTPRSIEEFARVVEILDRSGAIA
jgi:alkanesulfonate monooxygenase SsuD/methylene tetrahydromethanopterin reductase-like flavin-dependent oxidoreductase (luciferase family)